MWGCHEPQQGRYDYTGVSHPARDLVAFVQLAQELGFQLLIKPGPFIDAEVLGGGIPSWLLARHPEITALRYDSAPWLHSDFAQPRCSYLHPTYLEHVRRWYAAVSDVLLPFQWPDGPIIALQVDNETPGDRLIAGDVEEPGFDVHFRGDYNPYVLETLWTRWLARCYGEVTALGQAYGRAVKRFEDVTLPAT
jgi:beta-galactosidase